MGIGPTGDIAGGKDARRTGLEMLIYYHATVDLQADACRQLDVGLYTDARHHEIGREALPILQRYAAVRDTSCPLPEVKLDAVFLMELLNEPAQLRAHDPLQRPGVRGDDVHFQVSS